MQLSSNSTTVVTVRVRTPGLTRVSKVATAGAVESGLSPHLVVVTVLEPLETLEYCSYCKARFDDYCPSRPSVAPLGLVSNAGVQARSPEGYVE